MRLFCAVRRRAGFTLIEVLLAILLLTLLLAGAYGSIRSATRAMHAGEQAIERTNRLRVAQEFIRHQVSRVLPLAFGQDESKGSNYLFQGERNFMRFVAPMPGYLSRGGAYVQTLELNHTRDGLQLLFTDQMLNGFDMKNPRRVDTEPEVLVDQIQEGKFEFRTLDEEGKLGEWKDKWEDSSQMPLMVRIQLTMRDEARVVWPQMEIPLVMHVRVGNPFFPTGNGVDFGPNTR